jgi:hypothetical protein
MCCVQSVQAQKRTGLIFDDAAYEKTDRLAPGLNFDDPEPVASLRMYCPKSENQGDNGSCVGWATGYAAFTISLAKQYNIPAKDIQRMTRSAMYIYNQIKVNECPDGSTAQAALELLKNEGVCAYTEFKTDDCSVQPNEALKKAARNFKIKEFYHLFSTNATAEEKINATIQSIASNKPVIIGMQLLESFEKVGSDGWYKPQPTDNEADGHAMCVVGYDQNVRRFEIMNSWGTTFGHEGFVYMSYDDFAKYTRYGYQIVLDRSIPPALASAISGSDTLRATRGKWLEGEFVFKLYNETTNKFQIVKPKWKDSFYQLPDSFSKFNSYFRLRAQKLTANTYIYVLTLKPDNSVEILFPKAYDNLISSSTSMDIPLIPNERVTLELPLEMNNAYKTDQVGDDYLCILYSEYRIKDLPQIIGKIREEKGPLQDRLKKVLGEDLIDPKRIQYSLDKMKVIAPTKEGGYIAPIVLNVKVSR